MTFYEQQFSLGINYGAVFSIRHSTAIAQQSNGLEQRRIMWSQPLVLVNLARKNLTQTELDNIIAFHNTVKGSAIGFRLKDWSDYKATTAIGTGNGTVQTWQLFKRYSIGAASVVRPITKPVANTLTLYLDGVETAAGWSLDTTTGLLTTELTGAITVEFEFDVPVRFEQDQIDFTFLAGTTGRLYELADLTCTEIRIEPSLYPALDNLPDILDSFNLGYDHLTVGGPSFSTKIIATASEFESRKSYWDTALGTWNIGDRTLTRAELDYFIAFFRCARGMAIPFPFFDWQSAQAKTVRFAEDRISFQFNAYQSSNEQVIFNLGGVGVTGLIPPPKIDPETYVVTYIDLTSLGDQTISAIESAVAELRTLLAVDVYGSTALANKYVKAPIGKNDERYLLWAGEDPRDSGAEPKKVLILSFVDESNQQTGSPESTDNSYHFMPRNISVEPTNLWTADFDTFAAAYSSFDLYNCLVFSPTGSPSTPSEDAFNPHLIDAIAGNNGYPAMSAYNWTGKPNWNENATGAELYDAIISYLFS